MKNFRKLCMSLFVFATAFFMMPGLKTQAAQSFLDDAFSDPIYQVYRKGGEDGIGFPSEEGDVVKYTNLTKNVLTFTDNGNDNGWIWQNYKIKAKKPARIRVDVTRGGKKYSKTLKISWFDMPILKEYKIGSKSYLKQANQGRNYVEVNKYLTGKVSITPPDDFFVDPFISIAVKNGKDAVWRRWYIGNELPKNCVSVGVSVVNKKNLHIFVGYTVERRRMD